MIPIRFSRLLAMILWFAGLVMWWSYMDSYGGGGRRSGYLMMFMTACLVLVFKSDQMDHKIQGLSVFTNIFGIIGILVSLWVLQTV